MSLKEAHKSFLRTSRGPVHKDQRLQIKELDEWWTHKPRTPGKPKLHQNEPDTSPNQLKTGDKVFLDATDPHIVTTTPNEEIPLTATIPASKKRKGASSSGGPTTKIRHPLLQFSRGPREEALLTTNLLEQFFGIIELTYLELAMELCSTFHLQTVMTNYDDPGTV
ncbi:hypothetical protein GOBAR_AA35530 [Gossypium barbadense]|uniref:Uncharacterized protein n=1 Tax=Gossypium barbadense TaxID=3634 RepID=A0A2P5W269_GOSBA|nr:hypothetical protein GOBAR_AA35530 [Gossypium barbadense]